MACVAGGWRLFNNVNKDMNIFKVGVTDMPFRAKPHTKIAHGGAPWWCGKVQSRKIDVWLHNQFNMFGTEGYEHGFKGFHKQKNLR
jgi:hypothetical protein